MFFSFLAGESCAPGSSQHPVNVPPSLTSFFDQVNSEVGGETLAEKLKLRQKMLDEYTGINSNPFPKMEYSLVIADVNYGLDKAASRRDKRWDQKDFEGFFCNLRDANDAEHYVCIVFLHDEQIEVVLLKWCPHSIEPCCFEVCRNSWEAAMGMQAVGPKRPDLCVWVKDNIKDTGGNRLTQNCEYFLVCYWSKNGKISPHHFAFGPNDPRPKAVTYSRVTSKAWHSVFLAVCLL